MTTLPTLDLRAPSRLDEIDAADGFGALSTDKGNLPLKALDVAASITGLAGSVVVSQTFVNCHDEALEATCIFPLPPRAAVTGFTMEVAGRIVEAELDERGKARETYDKAIEAGQRAAIAEEERPDVFTLRVGNLPPGEQAVIRITLATVLPVVDGEVSFRVPLVVAPRYIPGAPLPGESVGDGTASDTDAVPDASRISPPVLLPGCPNPVRLGITVTIDDPAAAAAARASLPTTADGLVLRVAPGHKADRDFVLRFPVPAATADAVATTALTTDGSTFALTIAPPAGVTAPARPRDVVLVLDRSGSMGGWKMVAARRALARMVDSLTDGDRCAVLAFDNVVERPEGHEALIAATDRNRFRAVEFLARIDARGGTEMAEPLRMGLELLLAQDAPERDRVLVLVTDGQVGNEDQMLDALGQDLRKVRSFTVGIDSAVNEGFLQRMAGLNGGACELIESEDRLDAAMDRIHRRIATPTVCDLRISGDGIDAASLAPAKLPDVFAGAPALVLGRCADGQALGPVTVSGTAADGSAWSTTVTPVPSTNPALGALWARARLRDLEDAYASWTPDPTALEQQMVAISLAHTVLCRFTAFVAVDYEVVNAGGERRRMTQPVHAPAGWDMFGTAPGGPMPMRLAAASAPMPVAMPAMAPPPAPTGMARSMSMKRGRERGAAGMAESAATARDELVIGQDTELGQAVVDVLDAVDAGNPSLTATAVARLAAALRSRGRDAEADEIERLLRERPASDVKAWCQRLADGMGLRPKRAFWRRRR